MFMEFIYLLEQFTSTYEVVAFDEEILWLFSIFNEIDAKRYM